MPESERKPFVADERINSRLEALREFCERQGFELFVNRGSQREPYNEVLIRLRSGVTFGGKSTDSLTVALARTEQTLTLLKSAGSDAYLHEPHSEMGAI